MSRWRRFHYSASLAVILAAFAVRGNHLFSDNFISYLICFWLLLPVAFVNIFLEALLSRLLTDGGHYELPYYAVPVLAACVYCAFFYTLLQAWMDSRGGGGAR